MPIPPPPNQEMRMLIKTNRLHQESLAKRIETSLGIQKFRVSHEEFTRLADFNIILSRPSLSQPSKLLIV